MANSGMLGIREGRGVPAKRGGRVRYTGGKSPQLGTIRSAKNGYLRIQLDGEKYIGSYHPTWELEYLGPNDKDKEHHELPRPRL